MLNRIHPQKCFPTSNENFKTFNSSKEKEKNRFHEEKKQKEMIEKKIKEMNKEVIDELHFKDDKNELKKKNDCMIIGTLQINLNFEFIELSN